MQSGVANSMLQRLGYRSLAEFAAMSERDRRALRETARALRQGARPNALRGKNLAVLCDASASVAELDVALFRRAAAALGARVAEVRPIFAPPDQPGTVTDTARMLGRLYDALECIGMPAELVRRIDEAAGVPVFEALSSPGHPTAALAAELGDGPATEDDRCAVLQAVLLGSLT